MEELVDVLEKLMPESESNFKPDICPKCGEPTNRVVEVAGKKRTIPKNCKCRREHLAEVERLQEEDRRKQRQIRLEQIISNSLMDKKFRTSNFENWDSRIGNPKMKELGEKYVGGFQKVSGNNNGLLIYGTWGNGKTYLSSCIANALISQLIPVICVSINALMDRIMQTYSDKETSSMVLQSLNNADLLIIDDLGTEPNKDWYQTMAYNIIDSRYRAEKPIIITTNLTVEELQQRYHQRTYNRIVEMCTFIKNTWNSVREEKGKVKEKALIKMLEV